MRKNHFNTLELRWSACVAQRKNTPAGCSKRPDFSPAQPRRAKTRRSTGKAAANESTGSVAFLTRPSRAAKTARSPGGLRCRCFRGENEASGRFQHPARASQPGLSRAETRARRLSDHSVLCSHRSTRQTTRFALGLESAWLRSPVLRSPTVCA